MIQYIRHLLRRGTAAQVGAASGLEGEPFYATDTKRLYVSDGSANKGVMMEHAVPSSATDDGNPGDMAFDSSYIYICVAANTWMKCEIATW